MRSRGAATRAETRLSTPVRSTPCRNSALRRTSLTRRARTRPTRQLAATRTPTTRSRLTKSSLTKKGPTRIPHSNNRQRLLGNEEPSPSRMTHGTPTAQGRNSQIQTRKGDTSSPPENPQIMGLGFSPPGFFAPSRSPLTAASSVGSPVRRGLFHANAATGIEHHAPVILGPCRSCATLRASPRA
jgi:hypothetical protein